MFRFSLARISEYIWQWYHKRRKREADDCEFATPYVRHCCISVFALSNLQTAAEYLNVCRARKGSPQFPIEELRPVVVKWLAEWPRPIDLVAPETDSDKRVYKEARRYCDDRRLHTWVVDQNENRGLAPRTSALGEKLDEHRAERVAVGKETVIPRSNLSLVKNRMYFSRWRKRMNAKIGHLPLSGHMDVAEKREKVLFSNNASWKP